MEFKTPECRDLYKLLRGDIDTKDALPIMLHIDQLLFEQSAAIDRLSMKVGIIEQHVINLNKESLKRGKYK